MAERKTYAYRLIVTLPPEAAELGWEPDCWAAELPPYPIDGANPEGGEFRWPSNRPYFSASGARRRADLFRKYGAQVEIERSAPVTWPLDAATAAAGEGKA